ncbi:MAG TPA: epoxide hydrolase [Burkholderiaceae bacterium]|nr:epoxide hydrolase [Burkholderiaceae bacterium]
MTPAAFRIRVPTSTLRDLRTRLATTRWPSELRGSGWDVGTSLAWLQSLVEYWRDHFDWPAQEESINRFAHYRSEIDGLGLHFIHERGHGPDPLPLLLTHGWPDSFLRMQKIIPLLADPAAYGGDEADAFDVVVPSLPGFGFSDAPARALGSRETADLLAHLMTHVLGYKRFGAHGGDLGSGISEMLARHHGASMVGIHLTDVPLWHLSEMPTEQLSTIERAYAEAGKRWQMNEGAFALLQATRPQTLAYGLNDSPVGLAAWIAEKLRAWSDCDGDVERCFSRDELLTHITLYWVTHTIGSSFLPYYAAHHGTPGGSGRVDVPTGIAIFPKDWVSAPREFAERLFNLRRYTVMPRGGHFAALEQPDLLVEDIRALFRPLRAGAHAGETWPQTLSTRAMQALRSHGRSLSLGHAHRAKLLR